MVKSIDLGLSIVIICVFLTSALAAVSGTRPGGTLRLENSTFLSAPKNETNSTNPMREPYVHNCAYAPGMVERAYLLAKSAVGKARDDVDLGLQSTHGFKALFKNERSKYPIRHYLNSIHDYKGAINLQPDPTRLLSPIFVCVTAVTYIEFRNLRLGYDPWLRCQHPFPTGQPPQAFYADGTAYIFLCPAFLVQPALPQPQYCPSVRHNTWVGDSGLFYRNYQTYTLLYELIRFYLGINALNPDTIPIEQFEWNSCVYYGAVPSVKNPTNLLLYIACMLTLGQRSLLNKSRTRVEILLTISQWRSNSALQRQTLINHLSLRLDQGQHRRVQLQLMRTVLCQGCLRNLLQWV